MSHMHYTVSETEFLCLADKEDIKLTKSYYGKFNNTPSFFKRLFKSMQESQIKRAEKMIKQGHYYL